MVCCGVSLHFGKGGGIDLLFARFTIAVSQFQFFHHDFTCGYGGQLFEKGANSI